MASGAHIAERARQAQDVRLVVDAIPTLAWSAHADGSADFFNQRWLDYTGLSAEEARDWGWMVALHLNGPVDYWRSVVDSGELGEMEPRLRRVSMACIDGFFSVRLRRSTPMEGLSNGSEPTPTSKIENARKACSAERMAFWK
jgi:PAS domain-containing protein